MNPDEMSELRLLGNSEESSVLLVTYPEVFGPFVLKMCRETAGTGVRQFIEIVSLLAPSYRNTHDPSVSVTLKVPSYSTGTSAEAPLGSPQKRHKLATNNRTLRKTIAPLCGIF